MKKYLSKGLIALAMVIFSTASVQGQKIKKNQDVFSRNNLIAWCIVPYDLSERGPVERAAMLKEIGITKLAYDWREKHIPTFDQELDVLKKNNIKLQGFWLSEGPEPEKDRYLDTILNLLKRHHAKTELWCMFGAVPGFDKMSQEEKVKAMSKPVAYVAQKLSEIGCTLGLYNHGGWFGEPENQLAIIDFLKMPSIGIVYNFHHAEEQVDRFPIFFPRLIPHLYALNISGLLIQGEIAKVVPVGQGDAELEMLRIVWKSSYRGPIGLINESTAPDAKDGLLLNMNGLKKILGELGDKAALKTYN
jgi:hypothetical protein